MERYDVIVIGGGQSGLAVGYYLRRTGLSYKILDNQQRAGGAWLHTWESLRLFSPAQWSSLPGMIMPGGGEYYPTRDETISYLQTYESKYGLTVERPVTVLDVTRDNGGFKLSTTAGDMYSKVVVSAQDHLTTRSRHNLRALKISKGRCCIQVDTCLHADWKGSVLS